ncbi:hypothetical protein ACJZ2D_011930 [Fusarium nematophilum]
MHPSHSHSPSLVLGISCPLPHIAWNKTPRGNRWHQIRELPTGWTLRRQTAYATHPAASFDARAQERRLNTCWRPLLRRGARIMLKPKTKEPALLLLLQGTYLHHLAGICMSSSGNRAATFILPFPQILGAGRPASANLANSRDMFAELPEKARSLDGRLRKSGASR